MYPILYSLASKCNDNYEEAVPTVVYQLISKEKIQLMSPIDEWPKGLVPRENTVARTVVDNQE